MKRANAVLIARAPLWMSALALALGACAVGGLGDLEDEALDDGAGGVAEPAPDPDPDPGTDQEAPGESDINQPTDPPQQDDPPPAPEDPPADAHVVCYPGENKTYDACLPLVPYDPSFGADYQYPSHNDPAYAAPQWFVDLTQVDSSLMLSPNFSVIELMQEWKGTWGLYQLHMVEVLQAIREDSGGALLITSGYRNPGYNASVGGATYSRHMYGDAADMHSGVLSLPQLASLCHDYGADYVDVYTSHVHCDWRYTPLDDDFYAGLPQADMASDQEPQDHPAEDVAAITLTDGAWCTENDGFDEGEPLRSWQAFDADGALVEAAEADCYRPPTNAATVEVSVGGRLSLRAPRSAPERAQRLPSPSSRSSLRRRR